jgi:hypothetical protein
VTDDLHVVILEEYWREPGTGRRVEMRSRRRTAQSSCFDVL